MKTIFTVTLFSVLQYGNKKFRKLRKCQRPAADIGCWICVEMVRHNCPDEEDKRRWNQEIGHQGPDHPDFLRNSYLTQHKISETRDENESKFSTIEKEVTSSIG